MEPTSAASAASSSQGQVERFEFIQALSRGTVGSVSKTHDRKLNRVVALRTIELPDWVEDPQALLQRVLTEARNAATLDHPNITRLFGGGHKELKVSLVWDFVEGPSLRELLAKGIPLNEVFSIAKQLLTALEYANSKGVFHHCLNLYNLKLQPGGTLKVLDFGVLPERNVASPNPAKRLENEHYLSPEQIRNRPVDIRTNIFHAATLLYELFTTRNPFAGKHLEEIDRNITELAPTPLSKAHQRVPEEVSKAVLKGLAKNPQDRYQNYQEFIAALEAARLAPRPAAATPAPAIAASPAAAAAPGAAPAIKPAANGVPAKAPGAATAAAKKPAADPKARLIAFLNRIQWQYTVVGLVLLGIVAIVFHFVALHQAALPEAAEVKTATEVQPLPQAAINTELPPVTAPSENSQDADAQAVVAEAKVARRPAATVGKLFVSSVPAGAQIEVDGNSMGATPETIEGVPPGPHTIVLNKSGYTPETRVVNISSGHTSSMALKLSTPQSMINIAATPPGASILIDGRDTGRVSPAELVWTQGAHTITLHKEGYLDSSAKVVLKPGQVFSYFPSLKVLGRTDTIKVVGGGIKKIFGGGSSGNEARLQIKTEPKGATVTINGMRLEKHAPVELELDPGTYEVVLEMPGFRAVRKTVTVESGQKSQIEEQLQR